MAKAQFVRDKPHCNVGTIGHIDHGKTTTTGALLAVQQAKGMAKFKSYADIAKGGTVRDETKTVTIAVSHVEYESDKRHYAHICWPARWMCPRSSCSSTRSTSSTIRNCSSSSNWKSATC